MTLKNKILTVMAASLLFVAPTFAEEVTIGVEVAPIASLVVLGGNTHMDIDKLTTASACAANDASCEGAAKFFVNTNMPKWNVYLAFANGGVLKNNNGSIALVNAWLTFSDDLKVVNATPDGNGVKTSTAKDISLTTSTSAIQSMVTLVQASPTIGTTVVAGNWFRANNVNTFGVDVMVGSAGKDPITLAGSYTETLYITLATSY